YLVSDSDTNVGDGVYIDDVAIAESDTSTMPYPFFDDFENGTGNWLVSGHDWAIDSTDARSGTYCMTDSPEGDYPSNAFSHIILARALDLSVATDPMLSFWYKMDLYSDSSDDVNVQVSVDNGSTWETVLNLSEYSYGDDTSTWSYRQIDLSAYVGLSLKLRFYLTSDSDTNVGDGIYIDDVSIDG
ncbi:MAG: choice-of-anchor J domain-containing protein, partial [Deltaproteobacteria bacterium]|nr:choice-of-anchor J domain-containing protein [Deltaproteobacteria bacterium]MBN2672223.1 choice-of-anchor J domain-containing protein [Deltaproteobacteria bacterium]